MYSLPYFKEKDMNVVMDFVRQNPFAFVTGCSAENKPVVTQVPVFIDERDGKIFLSGHIMNNTDHHKALLHNPNVLVVFTGPHTFVSASWYDDKKQGGSWNYISVHARGTLKFTDEAGLIEVLRRTTNHFENNPHSGANFEDLSSEYVQKMVKAISAFEIEVQEIDNVFKLSQNRNEKSYDNIIDKLKEGGADASEISKLMEARKSKLFSS
ncbi:MAG: FMN-binding negative transcriptional regulator [Chitinophagaceae bacterium]